MAGILTLLRQSYRRNSQPSHAARRAAPARKARGRLALEALEDRTVPSAGALDPAFGLGGKLTVDLGITPSEFVQNVAVQANGKLIAVGSSYQSATGWDFAVARLNSDGSLDASFGTGGLATIDFGSDESAQSVAVQADGKLVVVGSSSQSGTGWDFAVTRLNSDGSLDASFGAGGRATIDFGTEGESARSVAVRADGKILVAGFCDQEVTGRDFAVVRLNADGSLDASFGAGGRATIDFDGGPDFVQSVAVQADGKLVVVGYAYQSATFYDFAVARLNSDGSLDSNFDADGKKTVDFGSALEDGAFTAVVQADGKLIVAGWSFQGDTGFDFAMVRLNSDGSLDSGFDGDGMQTIDFGSLDDGVTSVAVQTDGKLVAVGYSNPSSTGFDFAVARLNSDGSLDQSFDGDGKQITDFGASEMPWGMAVQPDGKIVVAGWSTGETTGNDLAVARYLGDDTGYDIRSLTDLTRAAKAGSTIPIKIELLNTSGQNVSAAGTTVTALGIALVSSPNPLLPVQAPGNSNPGNVFQFMDGPEDFYQFNLKTAKTLAAGSYLFFFTVEGDPLVHSLQFEIR